MNSISSPIPFVETPIKDHCKTIKNLEIINLVEQRQILGEMIALKLAV